MAEKKYEPIGKTREELALEFRITREQLDETKDPEMRKEYENQIKEIVKKYKKLKEVI